jgi:hypothetical protein
MDQLPTTPAVLPEGWAAALARGEADLAAGRVQSIDAEALCREIEAEAADMERQHAARHASPA